MGFWLFMFACSILIPATMIIAGYMMWKHCPRKINAIMGYRTKRSMKNMDTWKFAHDCCGRLWWRIGWIMAVPTVLAQLFFLKGGAEEIGKLSAAIVLMQLTVMLLSIIPVENALKKKFDKDGRAR